MMGLCGAEGVGKTTLAQKVSEALNVPFVQSRAAEIFKGFGLSAKTPLTFDQRMLVQEAVLENHLADVKEAGFPFISDRTPIDFATYVMSNLANTAETEDEQKRVLKYYNRCIEATSWNYNALVLVQPGIPHVDDPKRHPPSISGRELFNTLCFAYMRDSALDCSTWILKRNLIDLNERVQSILHIWEDRTTCLEHRATQTIN